MKMTATQKIFARHTGRGSVAAGELITADVDLVLGNDITSPVAIKEMKKAGERVKYPDKVVLVLDHFVPAKDIKSAEQCKTVRDFAVLNYDDPEVRAMYTLTPATCLYFSRREEVPEGMFVRDGMLIYRRGGADLPLMRAADIRIPGGHNLENAMLSALLALAMGVSLDAVRGTLRTFPGVEHRIEFVRELDGVAYINDSKGTNPASTIRAIEAMTRPAVLLLGGYDKHLDFHELFHALRGRVRALVILGATREQLLRTAAECGMMELCHTADTFREAVELARALARPGDAVLLSPASASWDMFDNFEQRGRVFKEIVNGFTHSA